MLTGISPSGPGPDAPLFTPAQLSKLAALPASEESLLALVHEPGSASDTRFIAAEALLEGNWTGWRDDAEARRGVADALVHALVHDPIHNRWGLPGSFVGPFGKRLLSLGAEAEAALLPLLSDTTSLNIVGSEAATLNSQANFRVSDLAAYLIAVIRQIP